MSFDLACQKVVLTDLKADADLRAALSTRIYDFVPQKVTFPYISLGEDALTSLDTSSNDGAMVTLTINTWSTARGRKQTKEIQAHIRRILHKADFTLTGFIFSYCNWESSSSFIDSDGETRHGVCIYNIYLTEA